MMEQIFPRIFDREPADRILDILTAPGIEVLTGARLEEVNGRGRVEEAVAGQRVIACDTIVWAAGVRQNVEIAREAGITIGELGGIKVDQFLQTSCPGIYACGDCIESIDMLTGRPALSPLWPNPKRQGAIAGLNSIGGQVAYEGAVSLVMEEIFGVPVASMGLTAQALKNEPVQVIEGESHGRYWRLLLVDDRIMGMQAIGETSGLGAVMAMMKNCISVTDFRKIVSDPDLVRKAAWYLPARQFLMS
jgi:NADH oxidase (H2O2-forming)